MPYTPGYPSVAPANGTMYLVTATVSPGTAFHTTTTGKDSEITIQATNNGTNIETLTVGWGGTAAKDLIQKKIPPTDGQTLVVSRPARLKAALSLSFWATTGSVISVMISVDEYSA